MGRFLDNIGNFAGSIKEKTGDVIELIDDNFDKPIIIDIKGIKRAGGECHTTARETSELCDETVTKAREMVDFGLEIKSTLDGFDGGISASTFAIIKDLIDGDKMRAAMSLAGELDDLALACVEKSVAMIEAMERGIDTLPDVIENRVENRMEAAFEEGGKEGDPELPDIEPDVRELETCVDGVRDVNLFTVMKSGKEAFNGLTRKGDVCKQMFCTIKDFAQDVAEVSDAIRNFELGNMIGKIRDLVKDIWRCLRLSDLIKSFAEHVGKLIKWIIKLFRMASEKLSAIWGALAHAKDCLSDCIQHVLEAMRLCDDARDKSITLVDTCGEIGDHLGNVGSVNRNTIKSIKDLADGDEIRLAIKLATNMDDIVMECVQKVIVMIRKVTEAFANLPDVIKEGISEDDGAADDDPEPADVEGDIEELARSRSAIDESNALTVIQTSTEGFSGVKDKVGICRDMISSSRGFAETCSSTIESFMGVWDLETAMEHLLEMCRLVKLGEMIKQFAEQIMRLVKANIAVMQAAMEKMKNIDFIPDQVEHVVANVVDDVKDKMDDMKDIGTKIAFWKK